MKILVADDEPVSLYLVKSTLLQQGYDITVCHDGLQALNALRAEGAPRLAILDWMMPTLDGPEVCQQLRAAGKVQPLHLILLTVKGQSRDIVTGLQSGADDYITKPFDPQELVARVAVGRRLVELQHNLAERVQELEKALTRVKQLRGLLPICSYCKRIRNDDNYWEQVEQYIAEHSDVQFSHGICPTCYENVTQTRLNRFFAP